MSDLKLEYVSRLSSDEILAVQTETQEKWGEGQDLSARVEKLQRQLDFDDGKRLTAAGLRDSKGRIITSLKRYHLALRVNGDSVPTVGFGAVFTVPEFRNKGLAAKLMALVMSDARAEGCGAGLLFSDIGASYYAKMDFHPFPGERVSFKVEDLPSKGALDTRAVELTDLPKVRELFHAHFPKETVIMNRNDSIHRFFRERNGSGQDRLILSAGKEIGYFEAFPSRGRIWLEELIVEKGFEEAALATLANYARGRDLTLIEGWGLPHGFETKRISPTQRESHLPMIRGFSPSVRPSQWRSTQVWMGSLDQF